MRSYIAREFPKHFDEGEDWLDRVIEDWRKNRKGRRDADEIRRLTLHQRHVAQDRTKPEEFFEPRHFRTLVQRYEDAFPPMLCTNNHMLDGVRGSRNVTEHGHHLSELVGAQQALATCEAVLTYLEDNVAVNAIRELQNQLNSLDSEGAPHLAEQDEESGDAQSDGVPNLAEQDEGSRTPNRGWRSLTRRQFGASALAFVGFIAAMIMAGVCASYSGNVPPVCNEIDDVSLTEPGDPNGTMALGGHCTDPDNDELTFTAASSDNDIVSASVTSDSLTLITGDGEGGTATITVTATDPDGRSATASFGVTVNPPSLNQPPDCVDIEAVTIVEGEEQEVSVSCSDPNGDMITLRVRTDSQTEHHSVSPNTASIDGRGTQPFTITGLSSGVGGSYVEIEVDDGKGDTDVVRFIVVVVDAAEDEPTGYEPPPVVQPKIEGSVRCTPSPVAVDVTVICEVSLSDGTSPFTYTWSGGSSSNTTGDSYSTSFSSEGSQSVSLSVSNAAGSDDGFTTVQVMTPPTISNLGCPSSAAVNETATCSPSISGTGPLTYVWSGGGSDGSSSSYSPSWSTAGTKTVSLSVNNDVGGDNESMTIDVVEPPTINGISCTPSPAATNASVNCTASISDSTSPFTYEWRGGASSHMTGDSYNTSFSSEGSHSVSLTVSNDGGSDDGSITIRVMKPPTISSLGCPSSATENQTVTCSPSVSGTEPLTYTWSGGGSGGSSASYSPSWNAAGAKMIWLSVRNAVGDDSKATNVQVNGAPRCADVANIRITMEHSQSMPGPARSLPSPARSLLGPANPSGDVAAVFIAAENQSETFDLSNLCNDPEGDSLTYTVEPGNDSVATGSVRDGVLTINAHSGGDTTIRVAVQDGRGGSTIVTVSVIVGEE